MSLDVDVTKDARMEIRLPSGLKEQAEERAEDLERSLAEYIRWLIVQDLKEWL